MIAKQKHIINKVFLEVNTNNKKVAYDLKDNLNVFLKQDVFPFIESYFEKIENSLPSEIVQISKLNLDLTTSSKNNFNELKQTIKEQFIKEIQKTITVSSNEQKEAVFISKKNNKLKSFLYFLEEGILPWNSLQTKKNRFAKKELQEIVKASNFSFLFQQKIKNKSVQIRLINQFEAKDIKLMLQQGYKDAIVEIKILNESLVTEIHKLNSKNQKLIWQLIINYLIDKNISLFTKTLIETINKLQTKTEVIQLKSTVNILFENLQIKVTQSNLNLLNKTKGNNIDKLLSTNNKQTENNPTEETQTNIDEIEVDYQEIKVSKRKSKELENKTTILQNNKATYYVENAGLILLHPFLKQFFKNCALLTVDSTLKNKELAVHLLHYVATKNEKQLESNLVFEKFLCGVPIKQSINRNINISNKLKTQTEELLESVIQNWGVLKNASTDLLRNEFLQRTGKISFKGNNPKINIERKTQDILLDKLPWNISILKLPWLDKLIFTDW